MNLADKLSEIEPSELATQLSLHIYTPAWWRIRDDLHKVPLHLRIAIVVLDFDTEVAMSGLLGFLENSTGRYLKETVNALALIEAPRSSLALKSVVAMARKYRVSFLFPRAKRPTGRPSPTTQFHDLPEKQQDKLSEGISKVGRFFTCDDTGPEPLRKLLAVYAARHRRGIIGAISKLSLQGRSG